jgi:hypothetical protein
MWVRIMSPSQTEPSVQGVAVGQLRNSQGLELLTARLQFQFGGDQLLHGTSEQ